jgi:hypothetical protein
VRCIPWEVVFQTRSLDISLSTLKKRGSCAFLGADKQKPYAPKCGQGKTIIDVSGFFYKNCLGMSKFFIPVKAATMYRVIINDCSRSRPCPCYEIFAAFM